MRTQRIIGRYTGTSKGPLIICFGAMHGNEPAGVQAIEQMLHMLKIEPDKNPDFAYKGRFVGILGNLHAWNVKQRFIEKDLNRCFDVKHIEYLKGVQKEQLDHEDWELRDIIDHIEAEIESYKTDNVIVLDLHTTSSSGGIFTITDDTPEHLEVAKGLRAPVILGFLDRIKGTTLHYFNSKNVGIDTISVTFESGQHNDPLSVNRAIAALANLMRTVGSVKAEDVESKHDQILEDYSKDLPKVAQLIGNRKIKPSDAFKMQPNYLNFQRVESGEVLATDKKGPIVATEDCMILMPLYQTQGQDGFFLIKPIT